MTTDLDFPGSEIPSENWFRFHCWSARRRHGRPACLEAAPMTRGFSALNLLQCVQIFPDQRTLIFGRNLFVVFLVS